jgi:hypothetical protein
MLSWRKRKPILKKMVAIMGVQFSVFTVVSIKIVDL